jgi:hypothetical protein
MSPVSRGRKSKAKGKTAGSRAAVVWSGEPEPCDCPSCTDPNLDPGQLFDEMIAGSGTGLLDIEDPLEGELLGAGVLAVGHGSEDEFADALMDIIPELGTRPGAASVALLAAIGSVADDRVATAASAAVDRLVEAGSPRPSWIDELRQPVTVTQCWQVTNPAEGATVLAALFQRAGREHAVVLSVDEYDCGAASEIFLTDVDQVPELLTMVEADVSAARQQVEPAEFRWRAEVALDARAAHDCDDEEPDYEPEDDEDGPGYPVMASFMRARLSVLPLSDKPKPPHPADVGVPAALIGARLGSAGRGTPSKLPPKRVKAAGPAPVYQIKVGLRGAKPPIWRRLEVPANIALPKLHDVIQIAFDWDNSHLHVFETPFGEFGMDDPELGHRSARLVTLEQVAPEAGSKIKYRYDFGDSWEHEILVEKVLEPDDAVVLPRCVGGRRAAPPEDCGGVWGYADLIEILADPGHEEHADRVECLGLDDAADFDPAAFNADGITEELADLR